MPRRHSTYVIDLNKIGIHVIKSQRQKLLLIYTKAINSKYVTAVLNKLNFKIFTYLKQKTAAN